MKVRILIITNEWKSLGKTKVFDWPFDILPEKENTISTDMIPGEIIWNDQGKKSYHQAKYERCKYFYVWSTNFAKGGVIELIIAMNI